MSRKDEFLFEIIIGVVFTVLTLIGLLYIL
jgi:hypothetical protein